MAERQYIGARYVPTFANPVQWNSNTAYEALTIVTNLGNSYTSRKPVPAGTPLTNAEYWVNTGNFNAQVGELENEVTAISQQTDQNTADIQEILDRIDATELANKKIVIYGDSNSDETATVSVQTLQPNWVAKLRTIVPSTTTIVNRSVVGMRMSGAAGIANAIDNATDLAQYDYMIIFGGVNDWQHSVTLGTPSSNDTSTFMGSLNVIANKINAANEDMKVFCISPIKTYRTPEQMPLDFNAEMKLTLYRLGLKGACTVYNWNYIEGFDLPRLNTGSLSVRNEFIVDGLHINTKYAMVLAKYIADALISERNDAANCTTLVDLSGEINTERWTVSYCRMLIDRDGKAHFQCSVTGDITNAATLISLPAAFRPAYPSQGHVACVSSGVYHIGNASLNPANGNISVQVGDTYTGAVIVADLMFELGAFYFGAVNDL